MERGGKTYSLAFNIYEVLLLWGVVSDFLDKAGRDENDWTTLKSIEADLEKILHQDGSVYED